MERTLIKQTTQKIGEEIILKGWVENHRVMGKMTFIDLRDKTGKVQCVAYEMLKDVTIESVVSITGEVKARPEKQVNHESDTGTVEIEVKSYEILNKAAALPIPVQGDGYEINEEARLKYRYLDLRRERLGKMIQTRSKLAKAFRDYFEQNDFSEVETPMLTASTKEGARDFVVPSRINPGKFYALPQSPQQYKQLLMTAGVEKYFQFARCIRDEDLRADRGFEFTQIDLEMSFSTQEEIMSFVEKLVTFAIEKAGGNILSKPFPRFSYKEAIEKFGADKFDLRTDEEKESGVLAFAWVHKFPFFKSVDKSDEAEKRDGKSGWTFTHNPFSTPEEEYMEDHLNGTNIDGIFTQQYDLVCNGFEVGGGSVRAHKREILEATYKIMGYSQDEIEESVGHMLKAFDLGTPPHGGLALGFDRLVTLMCNETSLKEAIPFPMTYSGRTAIMDGPTSISEDQLNDLGLSLNIKKD